MIVRDRRPWPERLLAGLDADPERPLARALAGPAALWAGTVRVARALRRPEPLPVDPPSLGVGNLRVGGSGKTPLVADLGRRLLAEGESVAVLTRGYRSEGGGDEPGWLSDAGLEVFADPDRRRAFERARRSGASRILLDDALQTRFRPRWVVAIVLDRDLRRPPRPLPAGPAREGARALERADALLVRREDPSDLAIPARSLGFRLRPVALVDEASAEVDPPEGKALLVSGLARPESFEADAASAGISVAGAWRESDHWNPRMQDRAPLEHFARRQGAEWVLVPEKNLRRVADLGLALPVRALRSKLEWDGGADPLQWLRARGIAL